MEGSMETCKSHLRSATLLTTFQSLLCLFPACQRDHGSASGCNTLQAHVHTTSKGLQAPLPETPVT